MRLTRLHAFAVLVLAMGVVLDAQWLKLPTPGLPRLPDGKPNLTAPAPRTTDGKPDLSGLWKNDGGDFYYNNIAADLQTSDVAPWAHSLFITRQLEFGKDSMETLCLPLGPAYLSTRYREFRVVQTPTLILFAYDDGMHREIFMDGRSLEAASESDLDGLFGRTLGRRCAGRREQRLHRSIVARLWRPPAHRGSADHRTLHPARHRAHGRAGSDGGSQGVREADHFSMPIALQTDTEMLEGFCENHHKSRERMSATKPAPS